MRHTLSLAMLFFALAISANASATMFKCTDAKGNTAFKDKPCATTEQTQWQKESEQELRVRQQKEQDAANDKARTAEIESWKEIDDVPGHIKEGILQHLNITLKDPESLKITGWPEALENETGYKVRLMYRAKNGFGGYVHGDNVFTTSRQGNVLTSKEHLPVLPLRFQ